MSNDEHQPSLRNGQADAGWSDRQERIVKKFRWPPWETRLGLWVSRPSGILEDAAEVQFGFVDPSQTSELAQAMGLRPALVAERLGWARCYAAWLDGAIATYAWVSKVETPIGEVEGSISPGDREIYIWDCATLPRYRRLHLYTHLLRRLLAELDRGEVRRVWIGALVDNLPANRALERAGFTLVLHVRQTRLLSVRRYSIRRMTGADLQDFERARRILQLGRRTPDFNRRQTRPGRVSDKLQLGSEPRRDYGQRPSQAG